MFDLLPNLIASVLTILFPIFASYKALRTSDPAQLSPWLMYWIPFALLTMFETHFSLLLMLVPFYSYMRLAFLLYLVLPQTQGARIIYQHHIHPFLSHHESRIENWISEAHDKIKAAGFDYLNDIIAYLKKALFGIQEPPARQGRPATYGGGESYAASLLSRFNLPSARDGLAAPASDFYGLLSAAASTLGRGVGGNSAAARDAQIEELSKSGTLIPANITDRRDMIRFVGTQREKLRVLLGALDKEAGELESSGGGKDSGNAISRSKSEVSFERIDRDEVSGSSSKETGGWLGWLGGQDKSSGGQEPPHEDVSRARSTGIDT